MRIFKRTQYDIRRKRGAFGTSFLAVFLVFVCKCFPLGFNYYPQLNDYFYTTLAENAVLFVILLGIVYSLAMALLLSLLEKLFSTSWLFVVMASMLPLSIEGTYILSNSIRIIPGLFLAAASANCFYYCLLGGRKRSFAACLVLHLACTCFSPQMAIFAVVLNVCTLHIIMQNNKKAWIFVAISTALVIFAQVYSFDTLFLAPNNATVEFVRPSFIKQLYFCYFEGGYYTIVYGFIRGLMAIIKEKVWVYLCITILISVYFGFSAIRTMSERKQGYLHSFFAGAGIFFVSIVFVFSSGEFLTFSNATVGIFGIALMLDALVRAVTNNNRRAIAVLASFILCVFCICAVSEISDYRETYNRDEKTVKDILENAEFDTDIGRVAILNLDPCYVSEQNYHYGEHIVGATASCGTLTAAIGYFGGDTETAYIPISLKKEEIYNEKTFDEKALSSVDKVYIYSNGTGKLEKLFLHYLGDGEFEIVLENGEALGKLVEKNHIGMFFKEN